MTSLTEATAESAALTCLESLGWQVAHLHEPLVCAGRRDRQSNTARQASGFDIALDIFACHQLLVLRTQAGAQTDMSAASVSPPALSISRPASLSISGAHFFQSAGPLFFQSAGL